MIYQNCYFVKTDILNTTLIQFNLRLVMLRIFLCELCLVSSINGPFAASGHMVHAGGQAAHWDIQNKATSLR